MPSWNETVEGGTREDVVRVGGGPQTSSHSSYHDQTGADTDVQLDSEDDNSGVKVNRVPLTNLVVTAAISGAVSGAISIALQGGN